MEDEFLLFVIASFVEKFFIFFRISRNNSSSFFIVVVVYSRFFFLFFSLWRMEKERFEILFRIISCFSLSLLSFCTTEERCFLCVNLRIPFFFPFVREGKER